MLTTVSLQNIKSFNKEASLKIAPITLIYGANSSGKSTLWKFLTALKSSIGGYQGKNFINLSRSYGFANNKTLSFDPNLPSTFGFKFSSIYDNDTSFGPSFFEDDGVPNKFTVKNDNSEEKDVKFIFSFENENTTTPKKNNDTSELDEIIKKMHSKDKLTAEEQELIKTLTNLNEKQKKINDKIKKVENVLESSIEKNIILKELKVLKGENLFATYKIYQLNYESVFRRYSQRITREAKLKNNKNLELEIKKILEQNFSKKFKFENKVKTKARAWDENMGNKIENKTFTFDFTGPDGPHDIKINDDSPIGYMFVPTWISDEDFFWKEHYDILQTMKKLMKNNSSNKDLEEKYIYRRYFEEDYNNIVNYYEAVHGIPAEDLRKDIPEIANTYNKTLNAMVASFKDFKKIMCEDLKTKIFQGPSFIPTRNFYGGSIYQNIFDSLTSKWVDTFVETEKDNLSNEGAEFLEKYFEFAKFSYDEQFKNLSKFSRELKNFKQNSSENYRVGMGMGRMNPSYITGILHDDQKHKEQIIKLLEKINLPFNIDTQADEDGDIRVSFSNKKISKTQEGIPLEQSGNALGSVLALLTELTKSENDTIIIEEPENKIHPKIQGNLIELITEVIKGKTSNAIIETHSEHFILRIQKLIREGKISPKLIAINYVYLDENGEGSKIDYMQINENGKFINKWRHGFFNERLNEL